MARGPRRTGGGKAPDLHHRQIVALLTPTSSVTSAILRILRGIHRNTSFVIRPEWFVRYDIVGNDWIQHFRYGPLVSRVGHEVREGRDDRLKRSGGITYHHTPREQRDLAVIEMHDHRCYATRYHSGVKRHMAESPIRHRSSDELRQYADEVDLEPLRLFIHKLPIAVPPRSLELTL